MRRALLLAAIAIPLAGQPKKLVNAQVDTRSAASGLDAVFRSLLTTQPQPAWIGYTVPAARSRNFGCDFQMRDGETRIGGGTVYLEPPAEVLVLYRVENNAAGRIRWLAPECDIDAGGVPVHWLTDVRPAESVALLRTFVQSGGRIDDSALSALVLHADEAADRALEDFAAPAQPEPLRRKAAVWLGRRGDRSFALLRKIANDDPSEQVRESAIQALASSRRPEAIEAVIAAARNDRSPGVRGHALSALARAAGSKAAGPITQAISNDPEREVKRRAVSALRQMPNGEGVPLLIEIAKSNRDPDVRKQAMSELGRSRDPRAITFFEEVLKARR